MDPTVKNPNNIGSCLVNPLGVDSSFETTDIDGGRFRRFRLVVLTQTWKAELENGEICRLGEMRMRTMTGLFQICFIFTLLGEMVQIWLYIYIFFSTGLKPPTRWGTWGWGWGYFFCYAYVMSRGVILWRQFWINSSFDDNWRCPCKIREKNTHTAPHIKPRLQCKPKWCWQFGRTYISSTGLVTAWIYFWLDHLFKKSNTSRHCTLYIQHVFYDSD